MTANRGGALTNSKDALLSRIRDNSARVAVVGLDYVGMPLAVAFAERGYQVVGIGVVQARVDGLNRGVSHVQDITSTSLAALMQTGRPMRATTYDWNAIAEQAPLTVDPRHVLRRGAK